MTVKLDNLHQLYVSMRGQGIERYRFEYRRDPALFDVFFFVDETPFALLFGARGTQLAFEFRVATGFNVIDTDLDVDAYARLCRALNLRYDPDNKFSPAAFLRTFNEAIPSRANAGCAIEPDAVARIRRDVEESEKIYFWGWLDNNLQNNQVSKDNLHKTRRILGERAYQACSRRNLSSRWTDDSKRAIRYHLPD